MNPKITINESKLLIGKRLQMSFAENKTFDLWRSFMPEHKQITSRIGNELFSVEVYPDGFYENFSHNNPFDKWAAVVVSDFDSVPDGMETLIILEGLYAVFIHKGPANEGPRTYGYIFQEWLPNSEYVLDSRPHLAVMGDKYKQDSPDSEEEIWIPIFQKS